MYRSFLFLLITIVLIVVDGTMTYDIFEFNIETVFDWLILLVIMGIVGSIYFADQGKKGGR